VESGESASFCAVAEGAPQRLRPEHEQEQEARNGSLSGLRVGMPSTGWTGSMLSSAVMTYLHHIAT